MSDYSLFASALPGFENVTQSELPRLGISAGNPTVGGVAFRGGLREMLTAAVWSRTISHVLCRIGSFQATKLPELRRKAAMLPWCDFISPQSVVNVRATCHRSRLYHSDQLILYPRWAILWILVHKSEYSGESRPLFRSKVGH